MHYHNNKRIVNHRGWGKWLLVLMISGCVTPFVPELHKYENLLVVDGCITNLPGSVYVNLSRTSTYDDYNYLPVNSAYVTLIDDLEDVVELRSHGNGGYVPEAPDFAGQIGRSYKIRIETADSMIYESVYEEIQQPLALDDVKYVFTEGNAGDEWTMEVQVDVQNDDQVNAYLYWEYAETWEFEVPYTSPYAPDSKICYTTVRPPLFLIGSNHNMIQKQFLDHPLYSVDASSNRLYKKYSVIVTQHTLSEETYYYYQQLLEVNENQGSLFDEVPVTLIGNMKNLSHPEQPVLGNFQVSAAVAKRIFITEEDVPEGFFVPNGCEECLYEYAGIITGGALLDSLTRAGWVVMDRTFNDAIKDTIISLVNYRDCFDCKTSGTNIKPDYWDAETK